MNRFKTQLGFSLLELIIVLAFIAVLMVVAIDKLLTLRQAAEYAAYQQTLGTMRSAITLSVANDYIQGKQAHLIRYLKTNPTDYLAIKPKNYIGVLTFGNQELTRPGDWFYNKTNHTLTYLIRFKRGFQTDLMGRPRIILKVVPLYEDIDFNQQFDPLIDKFYAVDIRPINTYTWQYSDKAL